MILQDILKMNTKSRFILSINKKVLIAPGLGNVRFCFVSLGPFWASRSMGTAEFRNPESAELRHPDSQVAHGKLTDLIDCPIGLLGLTGIRS